jgi:Immunity protein 35
MTKAEASPDETSARERAREVLDKLTSETGTSLAWFDGAFGVQTVRQTRKAWVYRFNSVEYLRTGDVFDQFLCGPVVVPKDGAQPWVMGTALTEDEQLRQRGLLEPEEVP